MPLGPNSPNPDRFLLDIFVSGFEKKNLRLHDDRIDKYLRLHGWIESGFNSLKCPRYHARSIGGAKQISIPVWKRLPISPQGIENKREARVHNRMASGDKKTDSFIWTDDEVHKATLDCTRCKRVKLSCKAAKDIKTTTSTCITCQRPAIVVVFSAMSGSAEANATTAHAQTPRWRIEYDPMRFHHITPILDWIFLNPIHLGLRFWNSPVLNPCSCNTEGGFE